MAQLKMAEHFARLRQWAKEVSTEKSAASRGETSHPTGSLDGGLRPATTGARAEENERDMKKDYPAGNVDDTPIGAASETDPEDAQIQIGTVKSEVGGQPSVERNYEGRPSKTKTTHPANVDIGPKYSFDLSSADGIKQAADTLSDLADNINAHIALEVSESAKTASATSTTQNNQPNSHATKEETRAAAEAGYELATYLGLSKDAADAEAAAVLEHTATEAAMAADRVGTHLAKLAAAAVQRSKKANSPTDEAAMAASAAGEEVAAPSVGAAPPGAGEVPPPAPGGEGGAGSEEQALQELALALAEMGMTPEDLLMLAQQAQAGGGAGGPAGGPGGVPAEAGAPVPGAEMAPKMAFDKQAVDVAKHVATDIQQFQRSGRFQFRPTKSASERIAVDNMKMHLRELTRRLGQR